MLRPSTESRLCNAGGGSTLYLGEFLAESGIYPAGAGCAWSWMFVVDEGQSELRARALPGDDTESIAYRAGAEHSRDRLFLGPIGRRDRSSVGFRANLSQLAESGRAADRGIQGGPRRGAAQFGGRSNPAYQGSGTKPPPVHSALGRGSGSIRPGIAHGPFSASAITRSGSGAGASGRFSGASVPSFISSRRSQALSGCIRWTGIGVGCIDRADVQHPVPRVHGVRALCQGRLENGTRFGIV